MATCKHRPIPSHLIPHLSESTDRPKLPEEVTKILALEIHCFLLFYFIFLLSGLYYFVHAKCWAVKNVRRRWKNERIEMYTVHVSINGVFTTIIADNMKIQTLNSILLHTPSNKVVQKRLVYFVRMWYSSIVYSIHFVYIISTIIIKRGDQLGEFIKIIIMVHKPNRNLRWTMKAIWML